MRDLTTMKEEKSNAERVLEQLEEVNTNLKMELERYGSFFFFVSLFVLPRFFLTFFFFFSFFPFFLFPPPLPFSPRFQQQNTHAVDPPCVIGKRVNE